MSSVNRAKSYKGIDIDKEVVDLLKSRYVSGEISFVCEDFTKSLPLGNYDVIIDQAAVTFNNTFIMKDVIDLAWERLSVGGLYIGIDWLSTNDDGYGGGIPDVDEETRGEYLDGIFLGFDTVHFADELSIKKIFSRFELLCLEEKIIKAVIPEGRDQIATWNIVAQKI